MTTKSSNYIREIKIRAAYILLSFFFTFLLSYWKWYQLAYIFLLSFSGNQELSRNFIFTNIYSAFSSTLWICVATCFIMLLPFVTYQMFCFLSPSWFNYEKRIYCSSITLLLLSWYLYIFLVNAFLIPELCAFFLDFQVNSSCLNITVQPKIDAYLSWASSISLLATLIWICALLLHVAINSKWIHLYTWQKQRKNCFFLSLLIGAFLSPPDIGNQFMLAATIYSMSESLIWISFIRERITSIAEKQQTVKKA